LAISQKKKTHSYRGFSLINADKAEGLLRADHTLWSILPTRCDVIRLLISVHQRIQRQRIWLFFWLIANC
jgi:hypothetical protein